MNQTTDPADRGLELARLADEAERGGCDPATVEAMRTLAGAIPPPEVMILHWSGDHTACRASHCLAVRTDPGGGS